MAINADIRDHAYQFFIEEAPELLQVIETGMLTLRQRSTAQVHNLMRAAHSLKGGSSSVGLSTIATLAHRLENIFKALYSETLEIDSELEDRLLQAYDCLRLPLMEQIATGSFEPEAVLTIADPIFAWIEERCGDALTETETYMPSSAELGVDMVVSIFEVDVAQGLDRLADVVAHPEGYEVGGELRAQVEVFIGFAEFLNLPTFGAIAETTLRTLNAHPNRALELTQLALADFQRSRQAILAGDRTGGTGPSAALIAFPNAISTHTPSTPVPNEPTVTAALVVQGEEIIEDLEFEDWEASLLFDDLFDGFAVFETGRKNDAEDSVYYPEVVSDIFNQSVSEETISTALEDSVDTIAPLSESTSASTFESTSDITDLIRTIDVEWSVNPLSETEEFTEEPALDRLLLTPDEIKYIDVPKTLEAIASIDALAVEAAVQSVGQRSDRLPPIQALSLSQPSSVSLTTTDFSGGGLKAGSLVPSKSGSNEPIQLSKVVELPHSNRDSFNPPVRPEEESIINLTVRVDSDRLERMNNLVGELEINRDGLSLQNEQLQGALRELLSRFTRFQGMVGHLRELSDQILVAPEQYGYQTRTSSGIGKETLGARKDSRRFTSTNPSVSGLAAEFDPLEMDHYGALNFQIQGILEDMVQLEEAIDDITLFARQSDQMLDQQRNMLTPLRDELIKARMLPLSEVLNRFPRLLRDLSTTYQKPVNLKLTGAGVLIEKAILEKLYDPLLHLLRNAFDHGIEPLNTRHQRGKPEQGQIEIRAYHKGNQTIIEVRDDGQGLNLDRIRRRAFELRRLSAEQISVASAAQLFELIFEPGFSTASRVSELSGRGVGLDVVRSQLHLIKGSVSVASVPEQGTLFTLALPLTLTIFKLVICLVSSAALALSADSIEEVLTPQPGQTRQAGNQRFLYWQEQIIPAYRLADLLDYACPLPETPPSKALGVISTPKDWAPPMLVMRQDQQIFALEVDRLVTEQEFVIKPFGEAIAPPSYTYGCTILGDGSLVPVIDGIALLSLALSQNAAPVPTAPPVPTAAQSEALVPVENQHLSIRRTSTALKTIQAPTILVADDSVALRRTLALSLERSGFRVLQARDGREAIEQLQQSSSVKLVICDIEMPGMNGFEFLNYRRQDPQLSAIPVVMLTSRSNDKHRWLATQLGAAAYFTKPYLEQEFFSALKNIMN